MKNPYSTKIVIIKDVRTQTSEVKLFTLEFKNKKDQLGVHPLGCNFIPGQFVEIGLPGFGEAPFVLCSESKQIERRSTTRIQSRSEFQICVRKAGELTSQLHNLKPGDFVTVRGPYGNGWPEEVKSEKLKVKSNLLLIAGGLGIISFRSLILSTTSYNKLQQITTSYKISLLYGAKTYDDLLFKNEHKTWQKNIDLHITLEKPDPRWKGHVGLITSLFDKVRDCFPTDYVGTITSGSLSMTEGLTGLLSDGLRRNDYVGPPRNDSAFLCGPPVMYKFVLEKLKKLKIPDENIYLSLERRMHCGVGVCQHCAIGSKYVCKDGPVFNWAEIKNISGAI